MFSANVGEGLELRLLLPGDALELKTVLQENAEHLERFAPLIAELRNGNRAEIFIRTALEYFGKGTEMNVAIVEHGRIVGGCALARLNSPRQDAEMGFWLDAQSTGRGLATMAVIGLTKLVFRHYPVYRIKARTAVANTASEAVVRRAGYLFEGTERASSLSLGQPIDMNLWSILATDIKD